MNPLDSEQTSFFSESSAMPPSLYLLGRALDQISTTFIITNALGTICYANAAITELNGFSPDEIIGKNPKIFSSGLLPAAFYQNLWNTITSGNVWQGDFINKKKNGELYYESARITPIKNPEGAITHYLAEMKDSTNEKQLEKRLFFKKALLDIIMNSLPDIIYVLDDEKRILYLNEVALHDLDLKDPAEAIGKHVHDFFQDGIAERIQEEENQIFQTRKPILNKLNQIPLPCGKSKWLLISKIPVITPSGEIKGIVAISKDITEIITVEEKITLVKEKMELEKEILRTSIAEMMQGVLITNNENIVIETNAWLSSLLEIPEALITGNDIISLLQDQFDLDISVPLCQYKDITNRAKLTLQCYHDKQSKLLNINISPLYQNGVFKGLVIVVADLTDIDEARTKAIEANEYKSNFLKRICYEIRTPLDGILGILDIALSQTGTSELSPLLNMAKECGKTLVSLNSELEDILKIESGKFEQEKTDFQLQKILHEAIDSVTPATSFCNVDFSLDDDVPIQLTGLSIPLMQVISIIIEKSITLLQSDSIYIRVKSVQQSETDNQLLFLFFDPHKSMVDQECNIVERNDPEMDIQTPLFRFFIDLLEGDYWIERNDTEICHLCFKAQFKSIKDLKVKDQFVQSKKNNVLIAEDSRVGAFVAKEMLKKMNCNVWIARSGLKAIEYLKNQSFDLIFMDIEMPEMNGIEAAKLIRNNPQTAAIPIIAMTAHAMDSDRARCMQAGMDDFISKPLYYEIMAQMISTWGKH